jgi:hypothetical protein
MSGIFQNIDPPPPSPPGECVLWCGEGGKDTLARGRGGWGVNILEVARLYSTYVSTLWNNPLNRNRTYVYFFLRVFVS